MNAKEVPVTPVTGLIMAIGALAYEINNEIVKKCSDLYQWPYNNSDGYRI